MHDPRTRQQVRLSPGTSSSTPNPKDPAWAAWQRHVDAGRIGAGPSRSVEQSVRIMRNEIALFGRVVTPELGEF